MTNAPRQGSFPRPTDESRRDFEALVPPDPRIQVRPMFGNVAAFVNGNMFAGLFGDALFVRLPEEEREEVIAEGGSPFAPMPGRTMKEYVQLPPTWRDDLDFARERVERAIETTGALPPKTPKARNR